MALTLLHWCWSVFIRTASLSYPKFAGKCEHLTTDDTEFLRR